MRIERVRFCKFTDAGLRLSGTSVVDRCRFEDLGSDNGGNPVGWFPGGGAFLSYSVSPQLKLGFAMTGNFGLAQQYDDNWVGRYYVQEATLIGASFLPSIAYKATDKLSLGASLYIIYGILKNQAAVNNKHVGSPTAADGTLKLDDNAWGLGVNLGLLNELDARTRFGLTCRRRPTATRPRPEPGSDRLLLRDEVDARSAGSFAPLARSAGPLLADRASALAAGLGVPAVPVERAAADLGVEIVY